MNQILVSDRIFDTPKNRKKKKFYRKIFMVSTILVLTLFSYYAYGEFDRNQSEAISRDILSEINFGTVNATTTQENILVVALDENIEEVEMTENVSDIELTGSNKHTVYEDKTGVKYTVDAILTIPSLGIEYPVLSETSTELLKISLNKFWGGDPNTVGNYCVAGHNYKSGKMFGKLHKIQVGDIIKLQDSTGRVVDYAVYNKIIVEPEDVSQTSQLTNGKKEVTLVTCVNSGTKRLVVKCREVE